MRIRRRAAQVAVLVGIVVLLQFVVLPASGTAYTLNGSADCATLGGVWSVECTFSTLTIAAGDSLSIGPSVIADITDSLTVDGSLQIGSSAGVLLDPSSSTTVNGYIADESLLDNYGTLTINPGASLYNDASGVGIINEVGATLNDLSLLQNNASATITNDGTLSVGPSGTFYNFGEIDSLGGLTSYGGLFNYGTLDNVGTLNAAFPGYFYNDGSGTINNVATISITTEFDNFGIVDSLAVVNVGSGGGGEGLIYNVGEIENTGSYFITTDGEIGNFGDLDNTGGGISNLNTVINECGGTVENAGGVTPNPVLYIPCAPNIISISGSSDPRVVTLGGNANLYSGGGSPLLITLSDELGNLGSSVTTDSAGDWSITTAPLAAGINVVYATATDVQEISSSFSSPAQIEVVLSTTTEVSCDPTSLDVGTPTTCTATVSEQGGGPPTTPTGTVDWTDPGGVFTPTSCTLTASGVAGQAMCGTSYVPGSGSEGLPIAITGAYMGDLYHTGSSDSYGIGSTQLGSGTSVSCQFLLVNAPSTCTATVTDIPGSANIFPGSTVSWTSSNLGSFSGGGVCTLLELTPSSSRCSLTYTPAPGGEGKHLLTGSYGGDTDHTGSSQSTMLTASQRSDSTTLICAPNPDAVNAGTTCTVVVKDTTIRGTPLTPGGKVTFSSTGPGVFSPTFCKLAGGTCSVTYTPNPGSEGSPTLTATYPGDMDHTASANVFHLGVVKRLVSVGVVCTPPFKHGSVISCTITVKDISPGKAITPKGSIKVTTSGPGGSSTNYCTLSGSGGTATCAVKFTPSKAGTYSVTAMYPGTVDQLLLIANVNIVVT